MSYMKYTDAASYHTAFDVWCKDAIEIPDITLLRQTEKAFCFAGNEVDKKGNTIGVWIPKSMCKLDGKTLLIGERFATEKGLI